MARIRQVENSDMTIEIVVTKNDAQTMRDFLELFDSSEIRDFCRDKKQTEVMGNVVDDFFDSLFDGLDS